MTSPFCIYLNLYHRKAAHDLLRKYCFFPFFITDINIFSFLSTTNINTLFNKQLQINYFKQKKDEITPTSSFLTITKNHY